MGLNVKEMSPLKFKCVRNEEYRWYLQMEGFMEIGSILIFNCRGKPPSDCSFFCIH